MPVLALRHAGTAHDEVQCGTLRRARESNGGIAEWQEDRRGWGRSGDTETVECLDFDRMYRGCAEGLMLHSQERKGYWKRLLEIVALEFVERRAVKNAYCEKEKADEEKENG